MLLANAPTKFTLPFAVSGTKNVIPVPSQIGITAGAASLTDGFPPLTRTPLAGGGVPPSGADMNGILYEMSNVVRWANAGAGYIWDTTFANDTDVGGYPKGARVLRTDGVGYWINTTDSNTTDPEAGGAGWVPDYTYGASAITMTSSNVTLTALQYGKPVIVITGTLTANLNLIFPAIVGQWTVINNTTGAYTITAKTPSGTGVLVADVQHIIGDGTNIINLVSTIIQRIRLTADTTYYVATTGNDTTGTGVVGSPWLTIQHAYDYIAQYIDMAGYNVTIQLADGTYTTPVSIYNRCYGLGSITIKGNASTPANTKITTNNATAFFINGSGVDVGISYLQLKTTGTLGFCVQSDQLARLRIGAGIIFDTTTGSHIIATNNAVVSLDANYSIIGSATYNHIGATTGFIFAAGVSTITLTGTPSFSAFIAVGIQSQASLASITFVGSATGQKYQVNSGSVLNTGGAGINYFPGDVAGVGTNLGTSPYGLYL